MVSITNGFAPPRMRLTNASFGATLNHMVNYETGALDATFAALSDPTRRAMLARLAQGESSIVELAQPFAVSLPAVLKHVRVLENAGLLERQKSGRVNRCRLQPAPMRVAGAWIEQYRQFWETQFETLARILEKSGGKEVTWQHPNKTARIGSRSAAPSRRRGKRSSAPGRKKRR
jgi:DNA-binding transcriptional ArsR family regulator